MHALDWRNLFMALIVCAVVGLVALWTFGCSESSLQRRIESARLAGNTEEVTRLEAELPAARAADDNAWGTFGLLGGLVGGPVVGGLFASIRSAAVKRRAIGAVATAIEAGKSASPEFAALFKDGAAHDAIKAAMPIDVAKVVSEVKS